MDYKLLAVALLVVAVAISAFLEWVKLTAKKQKKEIPTFVLIIVPAMLSIGLSWVVWSALGLPGKAQIIVLYALIVFVTQYYLSMEVLKRVSRPVARFWMRSKGMTDDEIKEALGE